MLTRCNFDVTEWHWPVRKNKGEGGLEVEVWMPLLASEKGFSPHLLLNYSSNRGMQIGLRCLGGLGDECQ